MIDNSFRERSIGECVPAMPDGKLRLCRSGRVVVGVNAPR